MIKDTTQKDLLIELKKSFIGFNDSFKKSYYDSLSNRVHMQKTVRISFDRIRDYEQKLGKHIENFNKSEMSEMFRWMLIDKQISLGSVLNTHSALKGFINTYFENNAVVINSVSRQEIKDMCVQDTTSKKISYADLQAKLPLLKNPSDQFFLLGLFEGIQGNYCREFRFSTMQDSNDQTREIWLAFYDEVTGVQLKGRRFQASPQLYEYAKQSVNEYRYYAQVTSLTYDLAGDEIVKQSKDVSDRYESNSVCQTAFWRRLHAILDYLELGKLQARDLRWGGIWYSLQKIQLEKGLNAIDDVFKTSEYQLVKSNYQLSDRKYDILQSLKRQGYL